MGVRGLGVFKEREKREIGVRYTIAPKQANFRGTVEGVKIYAKNLN